jgi:vitamin B12 transporter
MILRPASALLLAAAVPLLVRAQSRPEPLRLPPEVVTATRLPGGAIAAPTATASVLDGDQLRAEGITHLADALRRVPGLSLARTSSFGSPVALFLRGGQSNYVRVLIDGVPVNDPGGVLDLGRITLDDVERIEIVRGPASVLYGSEAVTGVIQLFTRRGGAKTVRAEVGGGSFGGRRASLGAEGASRRAQWTLQGDHHASDGVLTFNNAYRNDGLSATASLGGTPRSDLRLTTRYNASSYRYPTGSSGAIEDRNAERAEHRLLVGLDAGHRWSDRLETRVAFAANTLHPRTSDGADDAADTLGFFGYFARGTVTRRVADLRANIRLAAAAHLSLGGEYAREAERSTSLSQSEFGESPDAFAAWRETRAGYAQLLGDAGRLSYTVGARLDDNSAFGTFRTLRLGAAWRMASGTRLRASVGNAFKAPSFYENFATGFVIGNAGLRPERTRSAELGVESLIGGRAIVRLTGFTQRFRDLIQYTFAPPSPTDPNYYNIAQANAGGLELEATVPDVLGVAVTAGYTWTDTRVVDAGFDTDTWANFVAGGRLLRRPEHMASLHFARTVQGVGTFTAAFTRTGVREDRDFATYPPASVDLAPFTLIDLGAELSLPERLLPGARVQFRIENLADVRYRQIAGFAAPGRTLYAGLKLHR